MTPLELQLEGFTCYRRRTQIEWSGTQPALFAVTGPTGAGKSTLLDAITYSLYGQTPRLGGRGLDSLLSPGAASMHVQLTFRSARGLFRVTRQAQRRAAGVGTEVRIEQAEAATANGAGGTKQTWRQLPESERVRDANRAIEEIVGLDYAGFTRAVLLPQGAFDEFLRGDAGERRRLLVALLGLDRIEQIRELASRHAREAETESNALTRRLEEDYLEVSSEALDELSERRSELNEKAAALDTSTTALEAELQVAREHARVTAALVEVERRGVELARSDARVRHAADELAAARRAQTLLPALNARERAEAAVRKAGLELSSAAKAAADAAAEAEGARSALAAALSAAEARAPAAKRELDALLALRPALATLARVGGSLRTDGRQGLAPEPGASAGTTAGGGVGSWLDEEAWERWQVATALVPALQRAAAAVRTAQGRSERAARAAEEAVGKVAALEADLTGRAAAGKVLKEEAERRQAEYQAAVLADAAAAVREHVHVGDDCPVCGNTVTRLPERTGDGAAALAEAAAAAQASLEAAREDYQAVKTALAAAVARRDAAAEQRVEADLALTAALGEHEESQARLRERLPDLIVSAAEPLDAEELARALSDARSGAVAAHAQAVRASLEAAGVDLARLADPEQLERALKSEIERLADAVETARNAAAAAEHARDRAGDAEATAARSSLEAGASLEAAEVDLAAGLAAAGFTDPAGARAAVRDERTMSALAEAVEQHGRDRAALERSEAELRAELEGLPPLVALTTTPPQQLVPELEARLAGVRGERSRLAGELGSISDRISNMRERLEKKAELRDELTTLTAAFELHRQLALDLRSDRFQEYLMTHVQQRLARRASATLRLVTDGRFELHLLDGDYLVSDAWAGGELRSARTLSGGESFVASLSLALALSDTLAGNAALGALFLDEGFGTLDRNTLGGVASVLEALTNEGRMVGVITHVTELSERLPARLVVTKGPDGSTVAWDA